MKIDFPIDLYLNEKTFLEGEVWDKLNSLLVGKFVVFTGTTYSKRIGEIVLGKFNQRPLAQVELTDTSVKNNNFWMDRLTKDNVAIIMSIGGGSITDFSKRLAYLSNCTHISIPTILANDGLISPIAVLKQDSQTVSLPAKMPDHVFLESEVLLSAPRKYLRAAALDILSNVTAASDWEYAAYKGSERLNNLAKHLSAMAATQVLNCKSWDFDTSEFFRTVLDGQILSGLAMGIAGTSRPCSGSEHLLTHAIDSLGLTANMLHGELVGRATRFILFLQNRSTDATEKFFKEFDVPRKLLNRFDEEQYLSSIFSRARLVRPGRVTILEKYSDSDLLGKYLDYRRD